MNMAVLVPLLLAAKVILAPQDYVTGGVDLAKSGSTLSSYGWALAQDPIAQRTLRGQHHIYDATSYAMLNLSPFSIPCAQDAAGNTSCKYVKLLTAGGSAGRCYRAALQGTIYSSSGVAGASNAFGSATVCIPTTPVPGGDCTGGGGTIPTSVDRPDVPTAPRTPPIRIDPTAPASIDDPPAGTEPPEAEAPRPGLPEAGPITTQGARSCGTSPILFDLEHENFPLSDRPVSFDLDADGVAEKTNWTSSRSRVAFLAMDRNGNGTIDDGTELFGSSTPLSTGEKVPYGYVSLGEFDLNAFGGNFDGFIGPEDAVWQKLRLWVDRNHNGISEPDELSTLDQEGILRIKSDYEISKRKDQYGNQFIARGKAWREKRHGEPKEMTIWDVWFVRR